MITSISHPFLRVIFSVLSVLMFLLCGHQAVYAETSSKPATSAKAVSEKSSATDGTVSGGSGTVTPDLFTGTMSYGIPIEASTHPSGPAV